MCASFQVLIAGMGGQKAACVMVHVWSMVTDRTRKTCKETKQGASAHKHTHTLVSFFLASLLSLLFLQPVPTPYSFPPKPPTLHHPSKATPTLPASINYYPHLPKLPQPPLPLKTRATTTVMSSILPPSALMGRPVSPKPHRAACSAFLRFHAKLCALKLGCVYV